MNTLIYSIQKEIDLWGSDLYKRNQDHEIDKTLLLLAEVLKSVNGLFDKILIAKFFVISRFKKECKRTVFELDHVISLLGMKISFLTAKTAVNGVSQLGLVAGYPAFDTLDITEAGEMCLSADKHFFGHGLTQNYEAAFRLYLAAARIGYSRAQLSVGSMYLNGQGTKKSENEGVKWIMLSAKNNYPDALNQIGIFYREGNTVLEKNPREAVKYFSKAADMDHMDGMTNYANALLLGFGTKKSEEKAVAWFRKAADKGYAVAQNHLGNLYYNGVGVTRDFNEAVELFRKSAEQGYVFALNNLGICYEEGHGVVRDLALAASLYQRAAELGSIHAMNNLGYIMMLQQQFDSAKELLHEASSRGSVDALYNIAQLYEKGLDTTPSIDVALKYYLKAADLGHATAQKQVGDILYSGAENIVQDRAQAAHYYYLSAIQGVPDSQNNLGIMHEEGIGVAEDHTKAVKWYKEASQNGHVDAMFNLAMMLESGRGCVKNVSEAHRLFRAAASLGHVASREKLIDMGIDVQESFEQRPRKPVQKLRRTYDVPERLHHSLYSTEGMKLETNVSFHLAHSPTGSPTVLYHTETDTSELTETENVPAFSSKLMPS